MPPIAATTPQAPPRLAEIPPLLPCWHGAHDFTMRQRSGVVYCWYCVQVSPKSREAIAVAEARAAATGMPVTLVEGV